MLCYDLYKEKDSMSNVGVTQ